MFGLYPDSVYPQCTCHCTLYRGLERTQFIESIKCFGTIPDKILKIEEFLKAKIGRVESIVPGSAKALERYQYPMISVREIVANALIHRDYEDIDRKVHINVYSNRIEVLSPGKWNDDRFPNDGSDIPIENLLSQPVSKNQRLASILSWTKLFEGQGSGLPRTVSECNEEGAKIPTVRFENGFVLVTIFPIARWQGAINSSFVDTGISNIPIRVPEHYLGRDAAINEIDAALKRKQGRVAVTALHGLRGVGKTTLAAAYAELRRADYRATWWIRAQTESTLRADLVALGVRLGWVAADAKEEPALAALRERLRGEGEGLLLIYDNAIDAESLKPYLPLGGAARVLITSNWHDWRRIAAPVEIQVWPKETGADYLIARAGREKGRAEAEALSVALGGLPLAHEQAAAYCVHLRVSLAEYRRRFDSEPAKLLDDGKHAPSEYGLTVAKTFALAIDEAAKLHPAAQDLIVRAALLAPEPIPLFVLREGRKKFGEPLASQLAGDGLDEALAALRAFALIDDETIADARDPAIETEAIRLHRLVRAVAAGRCEGEAKEAARREWVEVFARVYPEDVWNNPNVWPRARRVDALAMELVDGKALPPDDAETAAGFLLDRLASYRQSALAAYAEARRLFERALAIHEKALGTEHPDTGASLNNLASLLRAQGDYAGAKPLYERALAIHEKALGAEHPDTGQSLNNLAGLLYSQGDYSGAKPLFERALAIYEKALGAEHPDTNLSRGNLGNLWLAQGAPAEALALAEPALAAHEKVLGAAHPWTQGSARVTADALDALGRGEEAAGVRARFGVGGGA